MISVDDLISKLVSGKPETFDKPKKFMITYTLQGEEYVECLDAYLDVRGEKVLTMTRDEIEKLHVDLGYYRVTLIFALKEMSQVLYRLTSARDRWLSKIRLTVLDILRKDRLTAKQQGNTLDNLTQREIDDNIISKYGDEYFDWDSKIHEAQADVDRVKELIKEIDSRRMQFQGIVKYRYSP